MLALFCPGRESAILPYYLYDVDAENMIQKGEVEIFKKKGRAEIYVPPEEDTSYTPSKGCQFLYLLMA